MTSKFTANFGVRWDYFSPSREKDNHLSFLDPVGMNPEEFPAVWLSPAAAQVVNPNAKARNIRKRPGARVSRRG